jgi:large subunit ribosomal protein L22
MKTKAVAKWVRISSQRARLVANEIRGKSVDDAMIYLKFSKAKAAESIRKTLGSAIANAENNFDLDVDSLFISEIRIDQGPALRRMKPRSRGRADIIRRPTSHITVVVAERGDS